MIALSASHLSWSAGGSRIVDDVSLDVHHGEVFGLIGPNGAGKTSLLRLLAGLRRPRSGVVSLDGSSMRTLGRREVARRLAIVEQTVDVHADISVEETVALGRTPHRPAFAPLDAADREAIENAIDVTGLASLRPRSWRSLSGGEQQRAQLARALAQQPDVIVLDEPTNHLDIRFQLDVLSLLRSLDITVVTALHDLALAGRFCDRIGVLQGGRLRSVGTPDAVLTAEMIRSVYGVEAVVETSGLTGTPSPTYLRSVRDDGEATRRRHDG